MGVKNPRIEQKPFVRIAGWCSMIQALLYPIAVIALAQTPLLAILGQDRLQGLESLMTAYNAHPWPLLLMCLAFVLLGLLGFAAVAPASAILLAEQDDGWLTFAKYLGLLCLAVITIYYTWLLATLPEWVARHAASNAAARTILAHVFDPQEPPTWMSWFMFAGMGLWVAVVGRAVCRSKAFSKWFVVICGIKGGGFWLVHAGLVWQQVPLVVAGAIAGGLIGGPAYHLWLGIVMRRKCTL